MGKKTLERASEAAVQEKRATFRPADLSKALQEKCSRIKRNGDRCGNFPIKGGTVCRFHGGAAPQVRKKADERLRAMADPLMEIVERAALSLDPDDLSPSDKMRLVLWALERAGFKGGVDVTVSVNPKWHDVMNQMLGEWGENSGGYVLEGEWEGSAEPSGKEAQDR